MSSAPSGSPGRSELPDAEHRDFAEYNAAQADRPVRPLARRAVESAGRTAVELGCGIGVEAEFLARHGWLVETIDADPSVAGPLAALAAHPSRLPIRHRTASLDEPIELPPAGLILSCATLPFVRRDRFESLWSRIRASLRPGGILAVDLFGVRDDWATGDGTFHDREQVIALHEGLEILSLEESERDGMSFGGPKHWHTFLVISRRPGGT